MYFRDLFDILRKKGQGRVYHARFQCVRPCVGLVVGYGGMSDMRGFVTFSGEIGGRPRGKTRQSPMWREAEEMRDDEKKKNNRN